MADFCDSLHDLTVVLVDCQTSGPSPEKAYVIELAWVVTKASEIRQNPEWVNKIESHLVALPEGEQVPRAVQRVTGITTEALLNAPAALDVFGQLKQIVESNVVVIHYAKFELPFLISNFSALNSDEDSDLVCWSTLLCTHEIAQRLYPDLPRRGLHALAGFVGANVPDLRRAKDHVAATGEVWASLIDKLGEEKNIRSLEQLISLLIEPAPKRSAKRGYPLERSARLALKDVPGVYRMLNRRGEVIYVGKATSLKKRVNSYFQKRKHAAERTLVMLTQAVDLDVTETATALEAALLENDEIKRLSPRYNVALQTGDRTVWYVANDMIRLSSTRDSEYSIGPFSSRSSALSLGLLSLICTFDDPALHEAVLRALLYVPNDSPENCFAPLFTDALNFVRERRQVAASSRLNLRRWLRIGNVKFREWKEQNLAELVDENDTQEDAIQENSAELVAVLGQGELPENTQPIVPRWTAELLSEALENLAAQGVLALRRARWLQRLQTCTLVWAKRKSSEWRKLELHEGELAGAVFVKQLPETTGRVHRQQVASFDVTTLDRLRILSSEIKRLVSENYKIRLYVGDCSHDEQTLARLLFWV